MISAIAAAVFSYMNDGHMDGWGAGSWVLMVVGMLLVWALLIFAVVWIVRSFGLGGARRPLSATEVLDRRLAEGEITVAEYHERKAALGARG
ncbi:MAG: hypothetical protein WD810_07120 [Solirubrobacterales bacterium]